MTHREIDRLKKSPEEFRSIALFLLRLPDVSWTDWELDFLESVSERELDPGPSTRQCEVLLDLRDGVTFFAKVEGFSVRAMIDETWRARRDLDEEDEAFIAALHVSGASAIRRRALRRLIGCARRVDVIQTPIQL